MKIYHRHDSKDSYKMNFILWGISKKDEKSNTTYAKEDTNPCKNIPLNFDNK